MEPWHSEESPKLECPKCKAQTQFAGIPLEYFQGQTEPCSKCGAAFDLWCSTLKLIKVNFAGTGALKALGARSSYFKVLLDRDELTTVNLVDHGIPSGAIVLAVDYVPQTPNWWPTEIQGNSAFKYRRERNVTRPMEFYPWPVAKPLESEPEMVISAVWVIPNNSESWKNLLDAFLHYIHDEYESAIIPANTAVECALGKLLDDWMKGIGIASNENIDQFLTNGATYGHQINVLLPTLMTCLKGPILSSDIRGELHGLNRLRNRIAHAGKSPREISKAECSKLLCAALFGVSYIGLLKPFLPVSPSSKSAQKMKPFKSRQVKAK